MAPIASIILILMLSIGSGGNLNFQPGSGLSNLTPSTSHSVEIGVNSIHQTVVSQFRLTLDEPYYFCTDVIDSITVITKGNRNLVERVSYGIYRIPTFTDATDQPFING